MNFANIDVKKYITEKGYTQKQIAKKLGITPEWFSRMLKNELADEEKQAVMMAIDGDLRLWRKGHRTYNDGDKCPYKELIFEAEEEETEQ